MYLGAKSVQWVKKPQFWRKAIDNQLSVVLNRQSAIINLQSPSPYSPAPVPYNLPVDLHQHLVIALGGLIRLMPELMLAGFPVCVFSGLNGKSSARSFVENRGQPRPVAHIL
jgi:hypothetical protein